jgi:general secretion pathway protein D
MPTMISIIPKLFALRSRCLLVHLTPPALPRLSAAATVLFVAILTLTAAGCTWRPFWETGAKPIVSAGPPSTAASEALAAGRVSDTPADAKPKEPSLFPGTDGFTRPAAGRPTPLGVAKDAEVTLNFVDVDIREVLRIVLGDTLGVNYAVDPAVTGTITFRSAKPLKTVELLPALDRILAGQGAALVDADGLYQVVPADQAAKRGVPVRTGRGDGAGQAAVVVPVQYVSAPELKAMLEPFKPPAAVIEADADGNTVIVSGGSGEVQTVIDLIRTFDVDWLQGMSFGLYPLDMTEAPEMVDNLHAIFGDEKSGPLKGLVRFVPIERMNAVLVISSRRGYLDKAGEWIKRLDVGDEEVARIFVYYCQNTRAAQIADVLSEIFSPGSQTIERSGLAPGLTPTTLRTARDDTRPSFRTRVESERPTGAGGSGLTEPRSSAAVSRADEATFGRETRRGRRSFGGGLREADAEVDLGARGDIRILPDEVKNALVILAKPRDYRLVEAALRKLDIVPLQVLIEATILEIVLNDSLRYGVEWFFKYGDSKVAFSRQGSAASPTSTPFGSFTRDAVTASLPGFTYFFQSSGVNVVVNALDTVSDVNVVSSPQLFVLDNQTASLQVGDQVPITTRSAVSVVNPDSPVVNSVEYRDTGVILNVTPRVNASGLVSLDIVQEVSDAVPTTTSDITSPTIQQRRIESTVAVQTGETVALGGLIRDRRREGTQGLPFLSRIPVLGALFGTTEEAASRTELLVLITPRVISNTDEGRRVTDELRQRLRRVTPLEERIR